MSADQTPDDQAARPPGPRGGIPQVFWLLVVFGLMSAGIVALVGFAIDKGDEKDLSAATDPANAAAAELYEAFPEEFAPGELELPVEQDLGVLPEDAQAKPPDEDGDGGGAGEAPEADLEDPEALEAAADPAAGEELFFANGCSACHGNNGEGGVGPTLAQTSLTLSQIVGQYRTPRGSMPAFAADRVSDQEVAHIAAWLQTLELPETIVEGLGTP